MRLKFYDSPQNDRSFSFFLSFFTVYVQLNPLYFTPTHQPSFQEEMINVPTSTHVLESTVIQAR